VEWGVEKAGEWEKRFEEFDEESMEAKGDFKEFEATNRWSEARQMKLV
jgi:hypothetical protein